MSSRLCDSEEKGRRILLLIFNRTVNFLLSKIVYNKGRIKSGN